MEQSSIEKRSIEKEEDENWQFMDEFQHKQLYASLHEQEDIRFQNEECEVLTEEEFQTAIWDLQTFN